MILNVHLVAMEYLDYFKIMNVYASLATMMMAHYNANNATILAKLALSQIQLLIAFHVTNYLKIEYWMFLKENAYARLGIMRIIRFV
jgi:hypothetical protein